MPKVSVIIATHNRAQMLKKAMDSVLKQTYEDFELIVISDGSMDGTDKVIASYDDSRIVFLKHEQSKGSAAARNTAVKNCSGYYIAFLDDDDEWINKDKLRKQVKVFENDRTGRIGIVCTSVNLIDENKNIRTKIIKKPKNLIKHILKRNAVIYCSTVLTKRDILTEAGSFDENLPRGVDSDFYRTCIVRLGYDVYFMEDITANIHEYGKDRITPVKDVKSINDVIFANKYVIKKYLFYYLFYPEALLFRMINTLRAYKLRLKI